MVTLNGYRTRPDPTVVRSIPELHPHCCTRICTGSLLLYLID